MVKKITLVVASIILSLLIIGCEKDSNTQGLSGYSGNYAFGGSTTVEPIMLAVIEVMEARYPELELFYDAPGSSAGISGVVDGIYSLGAASRDMKSSEEGKGVAQITIARDGVAVIVNRDTVEIEDLSQEELTAIYSGEITNWSEVGGADAPIVVANRDAASGTRECFYGATVKKADVDFVEDALIVTSNGDMVSKVSATPYSIGYIGFGYIGKDPKAVTVTINGVEPKVANVNTGDYTISRNLNVIYSINDYIDGSFEKFFVDYILSEEGQIIVESEKFIPLQ